MWVFIDRFFIILFRRRFKCLLFGDMAFCAVSHGRLELGNRRLFSKRILLAGLFLGLNVVQAFDDGIDVVADILEAVQSVNTHLSSQLSSIFV